MGYVGYEQFSIEAALIAARHDIIALKEQNKDLLRRVERLECLLYRATEVLRGDE